jgi:polyisoprenoid-binding protein YceI
MRVMPLIILLAGLSVLAAAPSPEAGAAAAAAAPRAFAVDGGHSSVVFRIRHLGVSNFYGRFNDIGGQFVLDEDDAAGSSVQITIQADSVDTASEKRDQHLRSPDFFNVKEFPLMRFVSESVEALGEDRFAVGGTLTLHGVSQPLAVEVVKTGEGEGMRGGTIAGFETSFTIQRSAFGMDYMPDGLGDDVEITLAVEARQQ